MAENDVKSKDAEIISIMSRSSEIAYRFYRKRFDDAMTEYQSWKQQNKKDYPAVVEWQSLLEGAELREKAEMWLRVCLHLKQHIREKQQTYS